MQHHCAILLKAIGPAASGADRSRSAETLRFRPETRVPGEAGAMNESVPGGPYRVRWAPRHEPTVPDEVPGPRFASRDEAESYASRLERRQDSYLIVEKRAPAGCWLQLASRG